MAMSTGNRAGHYIYLPLPVSGLFYHVNIDREHFKEREARFLNANLYIRKRKYKALCIRRYRLM